MRKHELKTNTCYFKQTWDGLKPFEIRYNGDRAFQKGDHVELQEYDDSKSVIKNICYTGMVIKAEISFVTGFKQQEDYVCFGLINIICLDNKNENP